MYEWLKDLKSAETRAWLVVKETVGAIFFPQDLVREEMTRRAEELLRLGELTLPVVAGGRFFYLERRPGDEFKTLTAADELGGTRRVLIDPAAMAAEERATPQSIYPSPRGGYTTVRMSKQGNDFAALLVMDVERGVFLPDTIPPEYYPCSMDTGNTTPWVSSLRWDGENGFWYVRSESSVGEMVGPESRYPAYLYYHELGRSFDEDTRIGVGEGLGKLDFPTRVDGTDGNNLFVNISYNSQGYDVEQLYVKEGETFRRVPLEGPGHHVFLRKGDQVYIWSKVGSPRGRIDAVAYGDLFNVSSAWRLVIAEDNRRIIEHFLIAGDQLVVQYSLFGAGNILIYSLANEERIEVPLPLGHIRGMQYLENDNALLFLFSSPSRPSVLYRYDLGKRLLECVASIDVPRLDSSTIIVTQRSITARDGVEVPICEMRRKGVAETGPVVIEAYGGYGMVRAPWFSAERLLVLEQGVRYVVAGVRGGGELGQAWYEAGRKRNHPNTHRDTIDVARVLATEGTPPTQIALQGGSYGGMTVLSAVNESPDSFGAVLSRAPITDGVEFAREHKADQGNPEVPEDLEVILTWSPLHTVNEATPYPPVLIQVNTGDNRVLPSDGLRMLACLEEKARGGPFILRNHFGGHAGSAGVSPMAAETAERMWWLIHQITT